MAVAFEQNATLQRGDLNIFLTNSGGSPQNAYSIVFALYYVDPNTLAEVLIGVVDRLPVNPAVGEYYASVQIPGGATVGEYRIRWDIVEFAGNPISQSVQEFAVIGIANASVSPTYTGATLAMITSLRILLRDQNPDKFYRFRPPEHEGTLKAYNQVMGEIWEDAELLEYLNRGLDWFNSMPPMTALSGMDAVVTTRGGAWRTAILWGAISHACTALSLNWIADEFSVEYHTLTTVVLPDGRHIEVVAGELWEVLHG